MTRSTLRSLAVLLVAVSSTSSSSTCLAFAPSAFTARSPLHTSVALRAEASIDEKSVEKAVECYIVNEEDVITEGEKPEVVCTSEPEKMAWMEGIDPDKLVKADGTEGAEECKEGASPTGTEEWRCE